MAASSAGLIAAAKFLANRTWTRIAVPGHVAQRGSTDAAETRLARRAPEWAVAAVPADAASALDRQSLGAASGGAPTAARASTAATSSASASPGSDATSSDAAATAEAAFTSRSSDRVATSAAARAENPRSARAASSSPAVAGGTKAKPQARIAEMGRRSFAARHHGGRRLAGTGPCQGLGRIAILKARQSRPRRSAEPQGRQAPGPLVARPWLRLSRRLPFPPPTRLDHDHDSGR